MAIWAAYSVVDVWEEAVFELSGIVSERLTSQYLLIHEHTVHRATSLACGTTHECYDDSL